MRILCRYLYQCNKWLSKDHEDGQTVRVLKLSDEVEDIGNGSSMLKNNFNQRFFSDHIWLSVIHRQNRSVFTRLQRLSCCLVTIMLTMATSAMWYGTENEETGPRSAFTLGSISITVHQLYTSVISCGIIAPPLMIIMLLFEKTDYSPTDKKYDGSILSQTRNIKYKLPFWFVYVAHVFVILSVFGGAIFTMMYAFEWGKEKSEAWLGCLVLSLCQSIFVIQPVKVMYIITLF